MVNTISYQRYLTLKKLKQNSLIEAYHEARFSSRGEERGNHRASKPDLHQEVKTEKITDHRSAKNTDMD